MQGKALPERSAEMRVYVGVDVCKDWLDVYLHPIGQTFRVANAPEGLKSLKRQIAGTPVALIVMEATAKYHRLAHRSLHAAGLAVAIVNLLRSRLFAEAIGQLAKTDRLDARVLAIMAESLEPKAAAPAPEDLEALQEIVRARSAAIADQTALSNQRLASQTAFLKAELGRRLKTLAASIARLDAEIDRRLRADPALRPRYDILTSIPGIGPVQRSPSSPACPNWAPVRARPPACSPASRRWPAKAAKRPAKGASKADGATCAAASTSPPSPPPGSTRNSPPSTNASERPAKNPKSQSPPSCENSSSSQMCSSARIDPGRQSMLDFKHRCSSALQTLKGAASQRFYISKRVIDDQGRSRIPASFNLFDNRQQGIRHLSDTDGIEGCASALLVQAPSRRRSRRDRGLIPHQIIRHVVNHIGLTWF